MKRQLIIAAAAILFLALVWPTAFRFEHMGDNLVRINRLTGTYEVIEADSEAVIDEDESSGLYGIDTEGSCCGCPSTMPRVTY